MKGRIRIVGLLAYTTGEFGYVIQKSEEDIILDTSEIKNVISLAENIFMFPHRTIGQHRNVYEGEVKSLVYARPCVIKFAEISQQNVKEAEILSKLGSHTNVISIIQSGTYADIFEDHFYIALDKCHNENLRQYLSNRKATGIEFDLLQAVDFAKQIIAGVMYIHDNNVVHLDLKPSNILITQDFRIIKIADFGLSMIVMSSKSKVFHKRQFGTNGYRPVESFGNSDVSMRTDIFSLGTVLGHLLSNGNDIFGSDEHIFVHNLMNDIIDTSGLLVDNPIATEHLIKCMVSKERCRRPNIWEVSDHSCWSGEEVECSHEYYADDEIYDQAITSDMTEPEIDKTTLSRTGVCGPKEFIKRMIELGFNRKPTIVIFDNASDQLYSFDPRKKSTTEFNHYPKDRCGRNFTAVSHGEYIYIFVGDGSAYKLEYGDAHAIWKRLDDWTTGDEISLLSSVASTHCIYLISLKRNWRYSLEVTNRIFKYLPAVGRWERLKDKPTVSRDSALHCNKEYLYCLGGIDRSRKHIVVAERLDLATMEWESIANMTQPRFNESAVEHRETLCVIGRDTSSSIPAVEIYSSHADQWIQIKTDTPAYLKILPEVIGCFEIDGGIFLVCEDILVKYDIARRSWSIVTFFHEGIQIVDAVLVKMS